ncbi:MAG: sigma 54-interacting transcriptional regulator [Desulfobacterales bacterium]
MLTKDGRLRQVNWFHVVLRDSDDRITGTLSIGEDVTDLQEAQKALVDEKERMNVILSTLDTGLALLDSELNVVWINKTLRKLFPEGVPIGEKCYAIAENRTLPCEDCGALKALADGHVHAKELVSRAIHNTSRRSQKPFIEVNCAALPANLVESELFGHEAGAFTGADRLRKGRFELADGGTIFLDEISELPLELQSKLLRVLQEGQFERVGGSNPLKVDVRVIAATNLILSEEVAEGRFRPDLFYRLNVYPITVPPLRTRREDIPLLVNHFVPQIAARMGKTVDQIPPHVLEKLTAYDWPGNVRELINILERAVITSFDSVIRLPEEIAETTKPPENASNAQTQPVDLQTVERQHIISVLNSVNWRISGPKGAAKILGLNPSTLRFRMQKLGISKYS